MLGVCQAAEPQPSGFACDDSDPATRDDACDGSGTCVGIDRCLGVTCEQPENECKIAPPCELGVCPPLVNVDDGQPCDDSNAATSNDRCVAGACVADLPAPSECHQPVTCTDGVCPDAPPRVNGFPCTDTDENACTAAQCEAGQCIQAVPVTNETPCDDGLLRTDFDQCVDGVCVGTDLCDTTECAPPATCFEEV